MERPKIFQSEIDSDDEDLSRDWLKIDHSVKNDGFRIGLEAGQEKTLQLGFNIGFREAMHMALAGGKLQGGICASLTNAPSDISKLVSSQHPVQGEPLNHSVQSPLQSLLTLNTDLLSSIPSLLQDNLNIMSAQPRETPAKTECTNSSSHPCCMKKEPALEYLEIFPVSKDSSKCTTIDGFQNANNESGSQPQDQKQLLPCELVCDSKSHFWNQLESFKMQARSLGVLPSNN